MMINLDAVSRICRFFFAEHGADYGTEYLHAMGQVRFQIMFSDYGTHCLTDGNP